MLRSRPSLKPEQPVGFLDKVKSQAEQAVKDGQEKLDTAQARHKADGLPAGVASA